MRSFLYKILIFAIVAISLSNGFASGANAAFRHEINYQGKLTDANSQAVADDTYDMIFKLYNVAEGGSAIYTEDWNDVTPTTFISTINDGTPPLTSDSYPLAFIYTHHASETTLAVGQILYNLTKKDNVNITAVDTTANTITISKVSVNWANSDSITTRPMVKDGLFSVMVGALDSLSSVDFNQDLWLGVTIEGDNEMTPRKKLGAVPAAFEAYKLDGIDSASFLRSDEPDTMSSSSASSILTVTQEGAGASAQFGDGTDYVQIDKSGNIVFVDDNDGASITGPTGGTLAISAGASKALNLTANAASTWQTSAGALNITAAADALNLTAAGVSIWKTTSGALTIESASTLTATSTGIMTFGTNNNPRMTILTDGKVGIATTTPSETLSVTGNIMGSGNIVLYGTATSTFGGGIEIAGFKMATGASNTYVLTSDASGYATWQAAGAGSSSWTQSGNYLYPDTLTWDVGIATSTPAYDFHVWGSAAFGTSTTPILYVNSGSGALNITAAAASIWKTTSGQLNITTEGGTDDIVLTSAGDTLFNSTATFTSTSTDVSFALGDAAGANKFYVRDSTGAAQFTVDSDGNVDIAGNFDITGTIDNGLVAWWPLDEGAGSTANDRSANSNNGTISSSDCPSGYILIPGNATYSTSNFCVMKYEAKYDKTGDGDGDTEGDCYVNASYDTWDWGKTGGDCPSSWVSSNVVSTANGSPIAGITHVQSSNDACPAGSHLMTDNEVQTINRNIEQVASNWQGGVVGTGCMYGGHMDNHPANALAASTDDNPYYGTTDTSGEPAVCPFDTSDGGKASKRIFTLSNGQIIWDWSGNMWEWLYGDGTAGTIGTTGGVSWRSDSGWQEWNIADLDEERPILGASSSAWTSSNGIGRYYGGVSTNAFARGGPWPDGANAGAFALNLNYAPGFSAYNIGLRCVRD